MLQQISKLTLLTLLLSWFAIGTAKASPIDIPDFEARVIADEAKVRLGPSQNFPVLTKLKRNKRVTVTRQEGSWYLINYNVDKQGYIHLSKIKKVNEPNIDEQKVIPYAAYVNQFSLNVHRGPGTQYKIIDKLFFYQKVYVTHHVGNWRRIQRSDRKKAYVHESGIQKIVRPGGPWLEG